MLRFLLRGTLGLLALAGALYAMFLVRLGNYTLYDHLGRIAHTEPAQELGGALTRVWHQLLAKVPAFGNESAAVGKREPLAKR